MIQSIGSAPDGNCCSSRLLRVVGSGLSCLGTGSPALSILSSTVVYVRVWDFVQSSNLGENSVSTAFAVCVHGGSSRSSEYILVSDLKVILYLTATESRSRSYQKRGHAC